MAARLRGRQACVGSRNRRRLGPGNPVWYHRSACDSRAASPRPEVKNCCARIAAQPSRRAHLSRFPRSSLFYFALVVLLGLVFWFTWQSIQGGNTSNDWQYSQLLNNAKTGGVANLEIICADGIATDNLGKKHNVTLPDCSGECKFVDDLAAQGVTIKYDKNNGGNYL